MSAGARRNSREDAFRCRTGDHLWCTGDHRRYPSRADPGASRHARSAVGGRQHGAIGRIRAQGVLGVPIDPANLAALLVLDDPAFDELAAIHEHDPLRRLRNLGEGRRLVDDEIGQEQPSLAVEMLKSASIAIIGCCLASDPAPEQDSVPPGPR